MFLLTSLHARSDGSRLCANEAVLIQLSRKTKAKFLEQSLLETLSECGVDLAAAFLANARAKETY